MSRAKVGHRAGQEMAGAVDVYNAFDGVRTAVLPNATAAAGAHVLFTEAALLLASLKRRRG